MIWPRIRLGDMSCSVPPAMPPCTADRNTASDMKTMPRMSLVTKPSMPALGIMQTMLISMVRG